MKTYAVPPILALLLFIIAVNIAHAQPFAYVNSAEILAEMPDVKQADANLADLQKTLEKSYKNSIEKFQADVAAFQQKVERGELGLAQQAAEQNKLEQRQQALAGEEQKMVQQLEDKRQELLKPIYDKVNQAIKDVARENGYEFILDQGVMLYGSPRMDVTRLVRAKLGF